MRFAPFVILLLLFSIPPAQARTLSYSEARSHVGETMVVEGVVKEVFTSRGGASEAWCRLQGSNPRPTVYKTVALPTELSRLRLGDTLTPPGLQQAYRPSIEPVVIRSGAVAPPETTMLMAWSMVMSVATSRSSGAISR